MTNIITDEQKIDELLSRGVHDVFTKEELKEKLMSGKQLHIKLGTDVTGADLHLGHAVIHRKLRDFQELGHKVTLIIGDFTTLVGDHSDKVDMRSEAEESNIKEFQKHYEDQFFKTVIKDQTTVRNNSEWLSKLSFGDAIELTKQFTVSQMLDRETFLKRYKEKKPIGLDEFLYPLMQGYDSVALDCDVELGGTDQTFNLLAGRKLMPVFGKKPQSAIAMSLLLGSDGRPMGKSLQNFISIRENPINMYGQLMSIVDEVIFDYFTLLTRVPISEIDQMQKSVQNGENPMKFKKVLAHTLVTFYHSKEDADNAQQVFETTVQNKEVSEDLVEEISINEKDTILNILKGSLTDISNSDIRRTIEQGGVSINDQKITDFNQEVALKSKDLIKFGKRKFFRIK